MNASARTGVFALLGAFVLLGLPGCSRSAKAPPTPAPVAAESPPSAAVSVTDDAPRAALEEARSLTDPQQHSIEFGRRLREWAEGDPGSALVYVRRLPAGMDRTQGVLLILDVIGHRDPDRALALAAELVSTREQQAFYNAFFARLAADDPAAAVSRLAQVPAGDSRDRAVRALAEGWGGVDLPAALAWAEKCDPSDRGPAMEAVLSLLVLSDPLRAIALAGRTLTGAALERTVGTALPTLALNDPPAAAAILSRLPASDALGMVALDVARAYAAQDAAAALAWTRTLPEGQGRDLALINVLEVWVRHDPAAAGQHVAHMSPGPVQVAAALRLARSLATIDPQQAVVWAQALADASARSQSLAIVASTWAQRDPASAARWAATTPGLPAEALIGAVSHWNLQDPAAAQKFVRDLATEILPPETKARLLAPRAR